MKITLLPEKPDTRSPAGAEIRYLVYGKTGNMIHSIVPPRQVNRAMAHGKEIMFVRISLQSIFIYEMHRRMNK